MSHAPCKLWLFIVVALLPGRARAISPALVPASQASVELERATARTHGALQQYSRILAELVGAYHVVLAQGQLSQADGATPIDGRLRRRLADCAEALQAPGSVPLPPLPHVYHSRAQAALAAIGGAATLHDLLGPSRALIAACAHLQDAERDLVVALAEAQAPEVAVLDPVWPGPIDEALAQLQRLVQLMGERPRPQALDAQAELYDGGTGLLVSTITWTPPAAARGATGQLCICALGDDGTVARCQDGVPAALGRWQETLPRQAWPKPLRYRISTKSPFGVYSRPRAFSVRRAGGDLLGPTSVMVTSLAPAADSPEFYRLVDAVQVTWRPSLSDATEAMEAGWDEARQLHAPHRLRGYAIFRVPTAHLVTLEQQHGRHALAQVLGAYKVAAAAPGATQVLDRPPLAALAQGLTYVVAAQADGHNAGSSADASFGLDEAAFEAGGPATVQVDLSPAWRLAAQGATWAHQPLAWERRRIEALEGDSATLQAARATYGQRSEITQRALWEGFWRSAPEADRQHWWRLGQALYRGRGVHALLEAGQVQLSRMGQQVAELSLYIEAHADVAAAVHQHWALLDDAGIRRARAEVPAHLVAALGGSAEFGPPRLQAAAAQPTPELMALQVAAWWHSRDSAQVAAVAAWWRDLPPADRGMGLSAWLGALRPETVQALVWPPWGALQAQEQQAWLSQAPPEVPEALWPRFLAHIEYQALPLDDRVAAVRDDVGLWASFVMQSRYLCRPADKLFNFELHVAVTFLGLGLLSGYLLGFVRVRPAHLWRT